MTVKANVHAEKFVQQVPSQAGKIFAITGTTSGTGNFAAKALVSKGAHVLALNRPSDRASSSSNEIRQECIGPGPGKVTDVPCDLQNFESVKTAGAEVKKLAAAGLDALVCNAGVMAMPDRATGDGYDVQMQTNHLSHFLLASTLLPALQAAPAARVVTHSSMARLGAPVDAKFYGKNGGDLGGHEARWERYHQSKLANVVFVEALKDKLAEKGITTISCVSATPGLAATSLQETTSENGGGDFTELMKCAQSGDDGALPLLHCVVGEDVESGDLVTPDNEGADMEGWPEWLRSGEGIVGWPRRNKPEEHCTSEEAKKVLWEESEKAVGPFFG